MSIDRIAVAIALIGAILAGAIALSRPALIPALTFALAVFGALLLFMKM
ncbi:hypothetical protein [Streptomyces sp. NPDC049949]